QVMGPGDDLARAIERAAAEKPDAVVVGGGDGTLSTAAGVLARGPVPLGVLPLGTLNHFARDLGVPTDLAQAVRAIAHGRDVAVDTGEVNGQLFLNNSSIGIYPHFVIEREQKQRLGWPKWPAAIPAAIASLHRFPYVDVELEIDGKCIRRSTPCVFVGNNEYELGGLALGERERLDEGVLTLHVTHRIGRLGLLRMAFLALFGRLERDRDFDRYRVRSIRVHTRHARLRVSTDGEVHLMPAPLDYRVRPRALRVRVPAG
ncbi:MAG TPA: diacylglycerol kinase family protein, partial [Xanthomonadales bacterium]|nr:diacylglycerol kinase family protein [Xanthomonadales bacterium]